MRNLWFGDSRDLVKWATLLHVARANALRPIIQVPYLRCEESRPAVRFGDAKFTVDEQVWRFFRDVASIEKLSDARLRISVIASEFDPKRREEYTTRIVERLEAAELPALVFLDPDTGLQPRMPSAEHTSDSEVLTIWGHLREGEWLVVYQHAWRASNWVDAPADHVKRLCSATTVHIARSERGGTDAAFLCAAKAVR